MVSLTLNTSLSKLCIPNKLFFVYTPASYFFNSEFTMSLLTSSPEWNSWAILLATEFSGWMTALLSTRFDAVLQFCGDTLFFVAPL